MSSNMILRHAPIIVSILDLPETELYYLSGDNSRYLYISLRKGAFGLSYGDVLEFINDTETARYKFIGLTNKIFCNGTPQAEYKKARAWFLSLDNDEKYPGFISASVLQEATATILFGKYRGLSYQEEIE